MGQDVDFRLFTDRGRRVIVLADEQAKEFGQSYVGTEHLLLAMLAEDQFHSGNGGIPRGIAGQALVELGVTYLAAKDGLELLMGPRRSNLPAAQASFTPMTRRCLAQAVVESHELQSASVGVEHILLAMVASNSGMVCGVLARLRVELQTVRDRVLQLISEAQQTRASSP